MSAHFLYGNNLAFKIFKHPQMSFNHMQAHVKRNFVLSAAAVQRIYNFRKNPWKIGTLCLFTKRIHTISHRPRREKPRSSVENASSFFSLPRVMNSYSHFSVYISSAHGDFSPILRILFHDRTNLFITLCISVNNFAKNRGNSRRRRIFPLPNCRSFSQKRKFFTAPH